MFAAADALDVVRLEKSGVTATVHVSDRRSTLELFVASGQQFLYVATTNTLEPPGIRSVWSLDGVQFSPVLLAVGVVAASGSLPYIGFWHQHRQVRGHVHRLGAFWLAEASGPRLRLVVDDGVDAIVAKTRRRAGPVLLRTQPSRLPAVPAQFSFRCNEESR